MADAQVIQLFRNAEPPEWAEFVFDEEVSEEVMDIIAGVEYDLAHIQMCKSVDEFRTTLASIKERVASLPYA